MPTNFRLKHNPNAKATRQVRRAANQSTRAIRRVLNSQIRQTRKVSSRSIRDELALTKQRVDKALTIQKATTQRLEAKVLAVSRGVLLNRFPHRQLTKRGKTKPRVRNGISVKVSKGGSFNKFKRGFLIRLKTGEGQGERFGLAVRNGTKVDDYEVLHGPSPSQALNTLRDGIAEQEEPILRERIQLELKRLIR